MFTSHSKTATSLAALAFSLTLMFPGLAVSEEPVEESAEDTREQSPEEKAYYEKLGKLNWVEGATKVSVVGDSSLEVPEGFVFLDQADTRKFLELNENLSDGSEVMIAPETLAWSAYISFADDGYVKDDEKIDADELLETMQENTKAANKERRRRGWAEMEILGWAVPPAYNASTKRLEWATRLRSGSGEVVNFFTKILGRKGHTTVILVAAPEDLTTSQVALNKVLTGYSFNPGSRYAEYVPGDKVAEYGLAALVLGGAAAVATKKGFWAAIGAFLAATWKLLVAALVAAGAFIRKLFTNKAE
jgi:uncharacterized membrane-anchored protein